MKLALATILSLAFTPLAAQDIQKGFAAYNAGDYATALQEWKPLSPIARFVHKISVRSYEAGTFWFNVHRTHFLVEETCKGREFVR